VGLRSVELVGLWAVLVGFVYRGFDILALWAFDDAIY